MRNNCLYLVRAHRSIPRYISVEKDLPMPNKKQFIGVYWIFVYNFSLTVLARDDLRHKFAENKITFKLGFKVSGIWV